ncbi:AaceriAER262Cp [[Ashbya] aceris (nom. inval.)]|nr:AaceriAER262Cp [[Ashbya] aceris (nom. inval.)]
MLARLCLPTRRRLFPLSQQLCAARLNSTAAQATMADAAVPEMELPETTAPTGNTQEAEMGGQLDMSEFFSVFPRAADISLDQLPGASGFGRKTYSVARSSTGNLPVYSEYKSGKVYTEVRKISGDIIQLRNDLQQRLPKIPRDSWTVIMQSKKLLIKGYYVREIKHVLSSTF